MTDGRDRVPGVMVIDAHEELIQHLEAGQMKIRTLSVITVLVAFLFIASYSSQLVLPLLNPADRFVTVDLLNPALIGTQVFLLALVAAWLYVGIANYLFATRLGRQVREIRALERDMEKRISG